MIARAAWVNLHYQPIIEAHPRHFCQHLGAKEFMLLGVGAASDHTMKESGGLCCGKIHGSRRGVPVIGCRAAEFTEAATCLSERVQVARPRRRIFAGLLA